MKYLSSPFLNVHPGYRLWAVVLSSWHVSTPALPWSQRAGRGRTKRCIHLSYQTSPPDQQWVPVCLIMECRVTGCAGRRTPAGNWVDELDLSLFLWSVILPFSKAQCYVCTQYMFEENDRSFPYPFNKVFCWKTLSHFIVSFLQEVHHCRRQIKYSKDKMWYLAKMVRPFSSVSVSHISPIKWGFFLSDAWGCELFPTGVHRKDCDASVFFLFLFLLFYCFLDYTSFMWYNYVEEH